MELNLSFTSELIEWRGPAPFFFLEIPPKICAEIAMVAKELTYGWGVIPAKVTIAQLEFTTSLFPKNGGYLLPVKLVVRKNLTLELGQQVKVKMLLRSG